MEEEYWMEEVSRDSGGPKDYDFKDQLQ